MVNNSIKALEILKLESNINPTLVNARFIKPFDKDIIKTIIRDHTKIITIEEGSIKGGFGSTILSYIHKINNKISIKTMGIPDEFIQHGTRDELLEELELNPKGIVNNIKNSLKTKI